MDSRLSAAYNVRAARIAMIPGGAHGIPINMNEGGEWKVEIYPPAKMIPAPDTRFCGVPRLDSIAWLRERDVEKYSRVAFAQDQTYTNVLGASKLNQQFTRVPGSYYDTKNFDIIGSEKYPYPPILWETTIGADSRQFGRSDGVKYTR
ncbi:hypothetical protein PBCVNEJV1_551R [Paramecium bursaria Chlorella virus NE-JV-1]|nr:hypothetical protein PBCVNEJV1_551R [Paramecium bursaria Chlorella virus NE-JV-1]